MSGTAGAQILPVSRVQREDGRLALSFDLAEGCGSVRPILDVLAANQAEATFFVTEGWAETHQEEIKSIAAAGHEIGNRGTDGRSMAGKPRAEVSEALRRVRETVQGLTGVSVKLFRAPCGEYDAALLETVRAAGYLPVLWDIDSQDWKDYGVESICRNVVDNEKLRAGSIVRLHGGAEYTARALEAVVRGLQEKGYTLTTISQLLS